MSSAVIEDIRDAASSTANGIPSRRRQISLTTSRLSTEKPGETLRARSTNKSTAVPTSKERTGHSCSSTTPSPSRLVAIIRTVEDCRRMASIRSAAASRMCSQLSNTSNRTRPSSAAATDSLTLLPGCWMMPRIAATASGTAAGSVTAASSKSHTPSGNSSASCEATSIARRVLPTPPTPVNVTSLRERTAVAISATSASRPIRLVAAGRRFPGVESSVRSGGKSVRSPGALQLKHRDRVRHIAQPPWPQIHQLDSAQQTAVDSATRI